MINSVWFFLNSLLKESSQHRNAPQDGKLGDALTDIVQQQPGNSELCPSPSSMMVEVRLVVNAGIVHPVTVTAFA